MTDVDAAFELFDADGDGFVSASELKAILTRPLPGKDPLTEVEVEVLVKEFDTNGNGMLSNDEFSKAFASIISDRPSLKQMPRLSALPADEDPNPSAEKSPDPIHPTGSMLLTWLRRLAPWSHPSEHQSRDANEDQPVSQPQHSRHDRLVAERLVDGTVRLLSADWLREQKDGLVLRRRQDLPEEAFVPCEQARNLFDAGDRGVAALSYGWLHPLHSDPHGFNTAIVIDFLRSERGRHVRAMFWDFASLPQKDGRGERTDEEAAVFGRGIK